MPVSSGRRMLGLCLESSLQASPWLLSLSPALLPPPFPPERAESRIQGEEQLIVLLLSLLP